MIYLTRFSSREMSRLKPFNRIYNLFRDNLASISIGLTLGILALSAGSLSRKWIFMIACGILLGFVLILAGSRWQRLLLFSMVLSTSIDADTYFFVSYGHVGGASALRLSASFIMLILLCVPWLWEVFNEKDRIHLIGWISYPKLLYLLMALIFLFRAPEPLLGFFQILQLLQAYLLFLYLSNRLSTKNDSYMILCAVATALALQGALAIAQCYTALPLNFKLFGGMEETIFEAIGTETIRRPSGFFIHPILLADFVVLSLPLALGLVLFDRHSLVRCGAAISTVLGLVALVLTLSRGAWIGMGVAIASLILLLARQKIFSRLMLAKFASISACLLLIILVFKGKVIYLRFTQSAEGPIAVRFELAEVALKIFRDHPLIGIGINNFTSVMSDYERLTRFVAGFRHPVHNLYLLELSETGSLGSFFFLLFLYGIFRIGAVAMRQSSPQLRYMAAAIVSSFVAYAVMAVADWGYRLPEINTIFWSNLGILGALYLSSCRERLNPDMFTGAFADEDYRPK